MVLLLTGFESTVFTQDFYNLDFEDPTFVSIPPGYDPDEALPGWTVFLGGNYAPYVFYDNRFLDSACVSILDINSAPPFEGEFTVLLQAGFSLDHYPDRQSVSIAQTGLIPSWAKTLLFDASPSASGGNFKVSIAGQNQPFYALASYTNYITYGMDIAGVSGLIGAIQFTSLPNPAPHVAVNGVFLDDIRFSSSPMQNQFSYVTNNGTITITKFTGPGGVVAIPGTINGLPVTSIGAAAFYQSFNLINVTIPDSVTSVGSNAFYNCTGLIGATIGTNVASIGDSAFGQCMSLAQITIPASVTNIGESAFYYCTNLDNITIPVSVTSIGAWAFSYCIDLQEVKIPNSVTTIGPAAFASCFGVANVTIGNGLTSIAEWTFSGCTNLANFIIPDNVTNIGDQAFEYCESVTAIDIPKTVHNVGSSAFAWCTGLAGATIDAANIGNGAFWNSGLINAAIGSSVTNIGDQAFGFNSGLTAITVDALNSFYSSLGGVLFNKDQTTIIEFPAGKTGSYTVPDSVTSIESNAFEYCFGLAKVTIGNGVTNIGYRAYYQCTGLTNAIIGNSVTDIADEAFNYCMALTGVYFEGNAPGLGGGWVFGYGFIPPTTICLFYRGPPGGDQCFGGRPTGLWNPQAQIADGSFGVLNNQFGFNITGSSNLVIVVEASTDLSNPAWIPVGTNTLSTFVGTNGTSYFSDPEWANYLNRFYRFRSP